jgi:hypothetical protein
MDLKDDALALVAEEFVRRFGKTVQVRREGSALLVQCIDDDDASVCISVDDPARPSFAIGYPAFDSDARSWGDLRQRDSNGVLLDGLLWIAGRVLRDGAVLPEFPAAELRRGAKRRR